MNDHDKLRLLLPHWIEHTGEHAVEFRRWVLQVPPVQEQLQAAAQLLEQAKGRLQEALITLGGPSAHPQRSCCHKCPGIFRRVEI